MDTEPIPLLQLPLFVYGESITEVVELFPAVWKATEAVTSPDSTIKHRGMDALLDVGAQRVSPLVAYMIATCLNDPDIFIRRRVMYILADILVGEQNGRRALDEVRKVVTHILSRMNEITILGLLEVSVADEQSDRAIFQLLNMCPYAGKHLGEIVSQWKHQVPIRQKAVYFIGMVGYLEALPILEKIYNRLEARQNGQYLMEFAPASTKSDDALLPYLRIAITQLTER